MRASERFQYKADPGFRQGRDAAAFPPIQGTLAPASGTIGGLVYFAVKRQGGRAMILKSEYYERTPSPLK